MFASYQEEIMSDDTLHAEPRDIASGHDVQHKSPSTRPIAGIDAAALSGSARASKLIGRNVYKGDTSIGHIEDVLVDLDHATSTAFILSLGGFLGIGKKLVAVPINQVKVGSEAKIMTDLTEAQLAGAPAFDFGIVDQHFSEGKH
ncbi:MAG TPA: PRC-barrel domain-containing protein [Burkholderiales bacterium]|jgi:sporulation protein YlmC with PRC-barrel domain|nr:PRC-barrel domain-containing protein [Burkholderiales bacterium]